MGIIGERKMKGKVIIELPIDAFDDADAIWSARQMLRGYIYDVLRSKDPSSSYYYKRKSKVTYQEIEKWMDSIGTKFTFISESPNENGK